MLNRKTSEENWQIHFLKLSSHQTSVFNKSTVAFDVLLLQWQVKTTSHQDQCLHIFIEKSFIIHLQWWVSAVRTHNVFVGWSVFQRVGGAKFITDSPDGYLSMIGLKSVYEGYKRHRGFYGLHESMNHFRSKFWQFYSARQVSTYPWWLLQHTELPAVACGVMTGLSDARNSKCECNALSFQIIVNFIFIQYFNPMFLFKFKVLSFIKNIIIKGISQYLLTI